MEIVQSLLVYSGVVPALTALTIFWLLGRVLPKSEAGRYAAAVALAIAFCGALFIPADRPPWIPERHWHWLPSLALAAMVLGPVSIAVGVRPFERLGVLLLLAILAGCLLTPSWSDLQPSRAILIPALSGYVFLLSALLEPLANRLGERSLCVMLTLVATAVAMMIVDSVSITYGRVALAAAGALAGIAVGTFVCAHRNERILRGAMAVFAVVVGGSAFVGYVEPRPPLTGLMLAPLAPLALWAGAIGPLSHLKGAKAFILQTALVFAPLIISLFLINARLQD